LGVSDPAIKLTATEVPIDNNLKENLSVHFSITCKPRAMGALEAFAIDQFGLSEENNLEKKISFRLGPKDLVLNIPLTDIKSLRDLMTRLDNFRSQNANNLIKTNTELLYSKHDSWNNNNFPSETLDYLMVELNLEQARQLVEMGPEAAAIATMIYKYNNAIESGIIADAFIDMLRFVLFNKQLALSFSGKISTRQRHQLIQSIKHIQEAIHQRSQGVYVGLEELSLGANPAGLGVQRILKALDAYIISLLMRLGKKWRGFVLLSNSSRYEHYLDLAIVPVESSLKSQEQWPITHETMHILQYEMPSKLKKENFFSAKALDHIKTYNLKDHTINEIMADVFDFAICCPLNINNYLNIVWKHLSNEIFEQHDFSQLTSYLIRGFSVICFDHFCNDKNNWTKRLNHLMAKSVIKGKIAIINKHVDLNQLKQKDPRGQSKLELIINEFFIVYFPLLQDLFEETLELKKGLKPQKVELKDLNKLADKLSRGLILTPGELKNPEALAWLMASKNKNGKPNSQTLAWLLSLWNLYHVNTLGPDLDKLMS
jgi:hypothetical protein